MNYRVTWRDRIAVRLANLVLRIATAHYRAFLRGTIEYGLASAAHDVRSRGSSMNIIQLARSGYEVSLAPASGGIMLRIEGGDILASTIVPDRDLDQHRVEAVSLALERMVGNIGDLLEREIRNDT